MSAKPILFYSKRCPNSQKLWAILSQENRLGDFIKICIEENATKIPPVVTEVPCILVSRDRQPITGPAIPMYLKSASVAATAPTPSTAPNFSAAPNLNKKLDAPPQFENSTTDNLLGIKDYSPVEMGSYWSDSYSFIQDNPSPMTFSFEFLNGSTTQQSNPSEQQKNIRQLPPQLQPSETKKEARMYDFNNKFEQLQKSRQIM
jgi:hypothetical protein